MLHICTADERAGPRTTACKVDYTGQEHILESKKKRDTVLASAYCYGETKSKLKGRTGTHMGQDPGAGADGGPRGWGLLTPPPHGTKAYCNTFDKYFSKQKT